MVDIQPQTQQPMSDDQELAKVLAGVNDTFSQGVAALPSTDDTITNDQPAEEVAADASAMPQVAQTTEQLPTADSLPAPIADGSLDGIKKDAIFELRPLVDKLELAPEEKFDTYLLLLRSTDDKDLVAPAHEAAKAITDETRRAQALLDIIKEIDFLSGQQAA